MATHSSILAWESPGQRSLAGYGPGGLVSGRWHRQQEQRRPEGALSPLGHPGEVPMACAAEGVVHGLALGGGGAAFL